MADETDPLDTISEAAGAISEAAANLSELTTSMSEAQGFFSLGQVSIGALVGSIIGALIAFFVRRGFAKADEKELAQHRRKETAIELHDRFNSSEVLKARAEAEKFLLEHVGKKFQDIPGTDTRINSVWLVAREYEFMSIAISEELADGDIVAKYAFEIFVYWLQHFRCGFAGEKFDTIARIKALEEFFRKHLSTKNRWQEMEQRQRRHINRLLKAAGKTEFEFSNCPDLLSQETCPAAKDA
jgi:hypothetical protein